MNKHPLVSIVTPSRNMGKFIGNCIKSVLAQDYPYVEHIIQDGASTDDTLEILKSCNSCVSWISAPDKGQSDGLNKALQRAKGDIILVLNADDELKPHACSWGVEQMQKYPNVAVVYGDQHVIDENGKIIWADTGPEPYDFEVILCSERTIPAQAAFIRRRHFEEVGFYADVSLAHCPDYEMWVRIGMRFPMKHVPDFITNYRLHPDSEEVHAFHKFADAKRIVINRALSDLATHPRYRRLKKRAISGNFIQRSRYYFRNKKLFKFYKDTFTGFLIYPSRRNMLILIEAILLPLCYIYDNLLDITRRARGRLGLCLCQIRGKIKSVFENLNG